MGDIRERLATLYRWAVGATPQIDGSRTTAITDKELRAVLDALGGWQPIETAPVGDDWKHRQYVLMWSAFDGWFVGYAWRIKSEGRVVYSDYPGCVEGNDVTPTHWMPLPSPPDGEK